MADAQQRVSVAVRPLVCERLLERTYRVHGTLLTSPRGINLLTGDAQ